MVLLVMVKVKCTLVQALRLCTGCMAHRGSSGIALLFLDHGTRRGWWVSATPWLLFTSGKDAVPIVQEAGWAPGPVWTRTGNLVPTRIWSLDRPARSQWLYQLSYPPHTSGTDSYLIWDSGFNVMLKKHFNNMLYLNFKLNFAFKCSVCSAKEPQLKWPPITFHVLGQACSTHSSQAMCCLQHSVVACNTALCCLQSHLKWENISLTLSLVEPK